MHQPIYWPYESVVQTEQLGRYPYSLFDIFNQRVGPYTAWPASAVQKGIAAGLQHFGAQVSFSGSLIENLNNLESYGNTNFQNWKSSWSAIRGQSTVLGNPRLDLVGFGYHHPLMGLIDTADIRRQIDAHRQAIAANFPGSYSKGIFPPENAFSPREIPALVAEGLQWVLVDNIHFDRACHGYPYSTSGNLYEPNGADVLNPDPNDWIQLNGLWAPTQTSARWGRQPHFVEYVNPSDGTIGKIIAVPADRYMGTEDARGGFGALNYDYVMSQLASYNTDPAHPILIVLAHDGDNYGGGTDSYYNNNFQGFVDWLAANPGRFVCTTVQDYLQMFPPDSGDIIHIKDGSWSGADNGDPEFLKWNGDPVNGYSPDRNSWGVVTAAKNFVETANRINPSDPNTANAWKYMLNAEASDYWYWDFSQNGIWDSHPTRACNQAVQYARAVTGGGTDITPPTIYLPQREPYNPGSTEWGINQPADFTVWTYAFDLSGLQSVTLKYRTSSSPSVLPADETYTGGAGVSAWTAVPMTGLAIAPQTNPQPLYKAKEYSALITGPRDTLVDYYIEAIDGLGNLARSPIRHVWVGAGTGGSGSGGVSWSPVAPTNTDSITVVVRAATQGAKLHWGVNYSGSIWMQPIAAYWPPASTLFNGTGPAVQSPMAGPDSASRLSIRLLPFNNPSQAVQRLAFVIHYNNDTWDNNSGQDYHITISGGTAPASYIMDGLVDTSARVVASNGTLSLYAGWNGEDLYVATASAQSQGDDMFIFVADSPRAATGAPWAKTGSVAGWSAFLGNESSNNWSGWYNAAGTAMSGSVLNTAGTALEGTINLQSTFGKIPRALYLAVGKYQTQDGGTLQSQVPAGNGNGTIEANEFVRYDYSAPGLPPSAPILLSPANNQKDVSTSVALRWKAVAAASHYRLSAATDSVFTAGIIVSDSALTDTIRPVSGLSRSTTYFWRVCARNSSDDGPFSAVWRFTTIPPPPPVPMIVSPADGAVDQPTAVWLQWNGSAQAANYRVQVATDSMFASLILDDSMITVPLRQVQPLLNFTTYYWRVRAGNTGGHSDWPAPARFTTGAAATFAYTLAPRWNLISLPLTAADLRTSVLFPQASTSAFTYNGSAYVQRDTLEPGRGYWLKFADSTSAVISGIDRRSDTIEVFAGWNLIGSIAVPLAADSIRQLPPGMIAPPLFGFDRAYVTADTLEPGRGYWVKVKQDGLLILEGSSRPAGVRARQPYTR